MSCNEWERAESELTVERRIELPADPERVWDELPTLLGDDVELVAEPGGALRTSGPDGDRVGVVDDAVPAERLAFRWVSTGDAESPPSQVEITLEPSPAGTILRLRETRLDGSHLERSAFSALARV